MSNVLQIGYSCFLIPEGDAAVVAVAALKKLRERSSGNYVADPDSSCPKIIIDASVEVAPDRIEQIAQEDAKASAQRYEMWWREERADKEKLKEEVEQLKKSIQQLTDEKIIAGTPLNVPRLDSTDPCSTNYSGEIVLDIDATLPF